MKYKTPEKARLASNRQWYEMTLAWKWIRKHRPDIEQLIRAEANKKYPSITRQIELPKSLDVE
jgi:hypothetical protein